jgi:hypothetical protein
VFRCHQLGRACCGRFASGELALGAGALAAGRGAATGLVITSLLCCPRTLASRASCALSIPVNALEGARTAVVAAGRELSGGAAGRAVAAEGGCFGATGAGLGRGSFGAAIGGFGRTVGVTSRARSCWPLLLRALTGVGCAVTGLAVVGCLGETGAGGVFGRRATTPASRGAVTGASPASSRGAFVRTSGARTGADGVAASLRRGSLTGAVGRVSLGAE